MSSTISVSNLSKVYKHYWGPRSLVKEVLFGVIAHDQQWALQEVSFELREGETFGIVGNNGAGKSTLLKMLAGTAFPTSGSVSVKGRVTALLELGAGFHPEFSGRDNIYFNGALLGLSREEIQSREKEIVDFSELEDFIRKPVKTYSSGMYLRLGFAVATGFDPSVLIIDEALAVGDQHFQKKCLDRIADFRRKGKTIVFCSHNLYQVETLCERSVWLDRGCVRAIGPSSQVIEAYTEQLRQESKGPPGDGAKLIPHDQTGDSWVSNLAVTDLEGRPADEYRTGETICFQISGVFRSEFSGTPAFGLSLVRSDGAQVFACTTGWDGFLLKRDGEKYSAKLVLPDIQLLSGVYLCHAFTTDQDNMQAYGGKFANLTVRDQEDREGLVKFTHRWETA